MKRSAVVGLLLVVALLVAVCVPRQALAQIPDRYLILPGQAIGPYSLDMTIAEFRAKLGTPSTTIARIVDGLSIPTAYFWRQYGIAVFAYTDIARRGKVYEIALFAVLDNPAVTEANARYRTAQGLGIGSHRAEVHQTHGEVWLRSWALEYFKDGVAFEFSNHGPSGPDRAIAVRVFRSPPYDD